MHVLKRFCILFYYNERVETECLVATISDDTKCPMY